MKFSSSTSLQIKGTLVARGTTSSPIVFTSNQSSTAPGDWGAIAFFDQSADASFDASGNYGGKPQEGSSVCGSSELNGVATETV